MSDYIPITRMNLNKAIKAMKSSPSLSRLEFDELAKLIIECPITREYKICPHADLRFAILYNANLINADLRFADLTCANLENAILYCSDLRGANLENAFLINANLYNAGLYKSNLENANLRGANLTDVRLSSANLDGAIIDKRWYDYIKNQNVINFDDISWRE